MITALAPLLLLASGMAVASSPVRLVHQSADRVVLEADWTASVARDGAGRLRIEAPGLRHSMATGLPDLPCALVTVAVPPRGTIDVSSVATGTSSHVGAIAAMADTAGAGALRVIPHTWHLVTAEGWLRHQRVVELALFPVIPGPAGVLTAKGLTVEVRFSIPGGGSRMDEPSFDQAYRVAVNHAQAVAWRAVPPVTLRRDPVRPPENAVKIYIDRQGICALSGADIEDAGIDLSTIDPATLRLTCRGEDVPFMVTGYAAGSVEPGDSVIFHGHPNLRADPGCRLTDWWDHYTAANVYWLSWGDTAGVRLSERNAAPSGVPPVVDWHVAVAHAEQDLLAFLSNTGDAPWPTEWYWRKWSAGTAGVTQNFDVMLHNPLPSQSGPLLKASLYGFSNVTDAQTQHHTQFTLNGNFVGDQVWGEGNGRVPFCYDSSVEGDVIEPSWLLAGSNTLAVRFLPDTDAGSLSTSYFDCWGLRYDRSLTAVQDTLDFSVPAVLGPGTWTVRVEGISTADIVVLDLVRGERMVGWSHSGTTLTFEATVGDSSRFAVAARSRFVRPLKLARERAAEPPLASTDGQAAYLIISYDRESVGDQNPYHNLFDAAVDLALARAAQLPSRAIDVQDVFDEFNWGIIDPAAIRDFLQYAFVNWSSVPPEHVLLFGDASWDYLRRYGEDAKHSFVPCWGYPISENYFVELSDGDVYPEMHIGRLPVEDAAQADNAVAKVLRYPESYDADEAWRKRVVMVVGGFNDSEQVMFESHAEAIFRDYVLPTPFIGDAARVYRTLNGYQPGYYNKRIVDAISDGCIAVNYIGHGAALTWGIMFDITDTDSLTNGMSLPVGMGLTCNSAAFGEPDTSALGEAFLRLKDDANGAIGFWSATARADEVSAYYGARAFFDGLCVDLERRMGPLTTAGKIAGGSIIMNMFALLGDPLVELAAPTGPDLLVNPDSLWITPSVVGEHHDIMIGAIVENQGRASSEAVGVRFAAGQESPSQEIAVLADTCGTRRSTRFSVEWNTGPGLGPRVVSAAADHLNVMAELREDNNVSQLLFEALLTPPSLAAPFDCEVVSLSLLTLTVNNLPGQSQNRAYEFQIAQSDSLTPGSTGFQSSGLIPEQEATTAWVPSGLQPGTTYFWRCKAVEGVFDGAWSVTASFTVDPTPGGGTAWAQRHAGQFAADSLVQLVVDPELHTVILHAQVNPTDYAHVDQGATVIHVSSVNQNPYTDPLNLIGEDIGSGAGQYGQFLFANNDYAQEAVIDLGQERTLGLLGSEHWIGVDDRPVWSLYRVSSSLDDLDYVEWGVLGPFSVPDLDHIPTPMFFSVETPRPVRYIRFEFGQGLPHPFPSGVSWGSRIYEVFAYAVDFQPSGTLTSTAIGPAASWRELTWTADTPAATAVTLTVLSSPTVAGSFEPVQGLEGLTASPVDLSAVTDAYLQLRATLSTTDSRVTPSLQQWRVSLTGGVDMNFRNGLTLTPPLPPPGTMARIDGVLMNRGNAVADTVRLVLEDSSGVSTDVLMDTMLVAVQPGSSRQFSALWPSSASHHLITATAEVRGVSPEVAAGDNTAFLEIAILPDPACVGLRVLTPDPQEYGELLLEGKIANLGSVTADSVPWRFLASGPASPALTPVDSGISGAVPPGESTAVAIAWPEPRFPGDYQTLFAIEPGEEITTGNDTARATIRIATAPDLLIDSLAFSNLHPPAGDPVGVRILIRNAGEAVAESASVAVFHQRPDERDTMLGEWGVTVGGGQSATLQTAFATSGYPGLHRVRAVADPNGMIRESDESNNTRVDSVVVVSGVDLLCPSGLEVSPVPVLTRDTVVVSATIRNAGEDSARAFSIFWECGDLAPDATDTSIAGLGGISERGVAARFLAPSDALTAAVRLTIDQSDSVVETNEGNNTVERIVEVVAEPDLMVRGEEIRFTPSAPSEDDTVSVRYAVRNIGGAGSGGFNVTIHHRAGGGGEWTELADTPFVGLGAGTMVENELGWVAVDHFQTHWFRVSCNPDSVARERSLANNIGERSVVVAPKDREPPLIALAVALAGFQDSMWVPAVVPFVAHLSDSGTGVDTTSVTFLVDDAPTVPTLVQWDADGAPLRLSGAVGPLPAGIHMLRVEAADHASNRGTSRAVSVAVADEPGYVGIVAMHRGPQDETVFVLQCASVESAVLGVHSVSGR
ncbi:MAG: C25 family cysteine peptidase, partial [Candidatus Eisenbacteria bacterium]|nr:C25 family cysteine peptidase [Candidatus Eisenbacteria bacterium]